MAFVNKTIINSKTGQSFRFIQTAKSTNGKMLEIESSFKPNSKEPPAHYHPFQEEDFRILQGELTVKINSEMKTLKQGDRLHIPANEVHSMWNRSGHEAVVSWKTQPALNSENLFETITGLANDNQTDANGKPGILQVALTVSKFSNTFRLANPPFAIQKILFSLIAPFAWLSGKRSVYKKYID
ncbi:MAG: cupin domain-containing protein [Bacteroidota bacterium]